MLQCDGCSGLQVPPPSMGKDMHALLESGAGADVTFKVEDEMTRAHRIILQVRRPCHCTMPSAEQPAERPAFFLQYIASSAGAPAACTCHSGMLAILVRLLRVLLHANEQHVTENGHHVVDHGLCVRTRRGPPCSRRCWGAGCGRGRRTRWRSRMCGRPSSAPSSTSPTPTPCPRCATKSTLARNHGFRLRLTPHDIEMWQPMPHCGVVASSRSQCGASCHCRPQTWLTEVHLWSGAGLGWCQSGRGDGAAFAGGRGPLPASPPARHLRAPPVRDGKACRDMF